MLEERIPTINAIYPLLVIVPPIEASFIEPIFQSSIISQFDLVQYSSVEAANTYLKKNNHVTTILLVTEYVNKAAQSKLLNLRASFPNKTIIVLSNDDIPDRGVKTLELGADDFLFIENLSLQRLQNAIQFSFQRQKNRQKKQQELLKSQERYQDIINNSNDAIYVCDLEGNLVDFNLATATLLDLPSKKLTDIDIHNAMHSSKRRNEFLVRLVAIKRVENFEIEIERSNGERRQCLISARMIEYTDFSGYNGIIRDITEQKQSESLRKARNLAKQSAEMKEQFIASISHEMRTPMNAILGMSNLVLKTNLNQEQHNYISSIKQSSEILLGVVNDILQISEIQNGKVKFENKNFDIHALLNNLINVMQYKAQEKNLAILLELDPNIPKTIRGDKLRLNQILYNLVGNAIKFTDEGHVKIYVLHLNQNDYSVQVQFMVEDTGIGIPKEKMEAIFESFTRIRMKDRIYEGTGLGLSIAKNLIEQQGGKIGVTSEIKVGSNFFFDLIFEVGEELVTEEEKIKFPILPEGYSFKLLLVEDHKMNQLVAKKTLEKKWKNIQLTIANDGEEAIAILKQKEFDIILMDLQMPKMNGYETTQHIRQNMSPAIASLPILAMTAHAHISQDNKFRDYGMDDYVLKPFEPDQLFTKISQYITIK